MNKTNPKNDEHPIFCKTMIFGPAGSGKTRFLGTANDDPRTNPMVILNYEGGTMSLMGRDIDIWDIRSWQDLNEAYTELASGTTKFKSIGIDSASEVQVFALLNLLESGTRNRAIPDLLEQGDYGIALTQMRRFLREFRDLPFHVFMTALPAEDIEPRIGTVMTPAFTGKFLKEAPGIPDVVGYLTQADITNEAGEDESHRVLLLQNYPKYRVKVRLPIGVEAPNELIDPTVGALLDVLQFN